MKFNLKIEDIKYLKLLYQDSDGNTYVTRAAIRRIDDNEMLVCSKFEENLNIAIPQEVTLSIICSDGLYKTKTTLKYVSKEEPYVFYTLEPPQGLEYQQNREFFRILVNYDCWYSPANSEQSNIETKTIDISANGVSIFLSSHFVVDDDSVLIINIEGRKIQTKVHFVRSEKFNEGYKLSFGFTKISESDRDFISQSCIKRQLQQRRDSFS